MTDDSTTHECPITGCEKQVVAHLDGEQLRVIVYTAAGIGTAAIMKYAPDVVIPTDELCDALDLFLAALNDVAGEAGAEANARADYDETDRLDRLTDEQDRRDIIAGYGFDPDDGTDDGW